MKSMNIPYGRQTISESDIQAVVDVLRSDNLTQGPAIGRFESVVATHCNVAHAVAVNSATSALHIACMALGVGPGDCVWTSPITFVASANCARYCGADVDFVDINPQTFNLCPTHLEEKLKQAAASHRLPKVIIPVHMTGQPCDMASISNLAKKYGVHVIEDASHAIGATYQDTVIGDCRFSDITVFSFHPVKIVTTGEGGVATTQNPQLARKMQLFRSHGITREPDEMAPNDEGAWYYEQICLGYNYRMTDLQAALGVSQMGHLKEWVAIRHRIADRYDDALKDIPITLPVRVPESHSALHLYVIQVDETRTRVTRRELYDSLRKAGIVVNVHYIPVHTQPDFQRYGFKSGQYPKSEAYYARCLSIPMYVTLTTEQQDYVIEKIRAVFA